MLRACRFTCVATTWVKTQGWGFGDAVVSGPDWATSGGWKSLTGTGIRTSSLRLVMEDKLFWLKGSLLVTTRLPLHCTPTEESFWTLLYDAVKWRGLVKMASAQHEMSMYPGIYPRNLWSMEGVCGICSGGSSAGKKGFPVIESLKIAKLAQGKIRKCCCSCLVLYDPGMESLISSEGK